MDKPHLIITCACLTVCVGLCVSVRARITSFTLGLYRTSVMESNLKSNLSVLFSLLFF